MSYPPQGYPLTDLDPIFDIVNAMLELQETGGTITTDGTEQIVYRNDRPMGVFEPRVVQIDFTNQTAAEIIVVRTYYRSRVAGGFIQAAARTFAGAQDPALRDIELKPNRHGVRVSMQRTAGGALDYDWGTLYNI